jgi:hypothetical protein
VTNLREELRMATRRVLSLSLGVAVLGIAGLAGAQAPEWAAFGRKPESTSTTAQGLRGRIGELSVPARFKAGALQTLDAALALRPRPEDRNDAVIEANRAWISFNGSSKAGHEVKKYVSVSAVDAKRSTLMTLTSTIYRDGRVRDLWREVTPVGQGYHVEAISYSPGKVDGKAISYSGRRPSKAFLVDGAGRRIITLTPDQALTLRYNGITARGNRITLPAR